MLYKHADIQEFLEEIGSSRALNIEALVTSASKMKNLTYVSFADLLKKMCSTDLSVEDFFELADEKLKNDDVYNEVKSEVLCTEHVNPDNLHTTGNDVGFGILAPQM